MTTAMNNPIVSILTPCYNASATIRQAIESVLAQTYPHWEMILVDDCSTDNTEAVIKEYAANDNRIIYLRTDRNTGAPSIPRNIGLDYAKGEYVALLDSDDVWLPQKLEEQVAFAINNDYDFVYSNYEKMDWQGKRRGRIVRVRSISSYWDILESCEIPCLTVLLKRELIQDVRFKPINKEDYACWLEILRDGHKAYNTGKVHAVYRESKYSRSGNKLKMIKEQWQVLRYVEGVKKIPAAYFMIRYAMRGFFKFIK